MRVTERWRARGESPGSKPRLRAPTYVGHTVEEWEEDADEADEEADEELTDITEWGLLPIPPLTSPIVHTEPVRRRGTGKKDPRMTQLMGTEVWLYLKHHT